VIFFSLFGNCRMFVMIPINQSCFQSGHGKCIVKQGLTWILDRLRLTVVYVPLPGCTDSSAERLEENRCRQMSLYQTRHVFLFLFLMRRRMHIENCVWNFRILFHFDSQFGRLSINEWFQFIPGAGKHIVVINQLDFFPIPLLQ